MDWDTDRDVGADDGAATELLRYLHRGGTHFYVWELPSKLAYWSRVGDSLPSVPGARDLYFGVHPTARKGSATQRSRIETVSAVNCLFAESDAREEDRRGQFLTKDAVLAHIATLPCPPSVVVDSGGGFQCYWLLEDTSAISTADSRRHIARVQALWVDAVGGDSGSKDLARVLRLPGTLNRKYDPPRPVDFVEADLLRTCTLAELGEAAESLASGSGTRSPVTPSTSTLDDGVVLDTARNAANGSKFQRLFDHGDMTEYGDDHSRADMALVAMLAFYTGNDAAAIDRLFRRSALMRDKWADRADYRDRTIRAATADVAQVCDHAKGRATTEASPAGRSAGWLAPAIREDARGVEDERHGACPWLEEYVAFASEQSPRSYSDFHTAVGLWMLATVAARRVKVGFGGARFTPFQALLVAPSTDYAKTTAVKVGLGLLREAGLDFLLAPDDSTPQALIVSMKVRDTYNVASLDDGRRAALREGIAFAGQKGWFYEEFGGHLRRMSRADSAYADFHGMLRKLYDCPATYRHATVSRGEDHVEQPYLSLLGNLTPTDLAPFSGKHDAMWSDGFWARFAFVAVPPGPEPSRARFPTGARVYPGSLIRPLEAWHQRLGVPRVTFESVGEDEGTVRAVVEPAAIRTIALPPEIVDLFYAYEDALLDVRQSDGWDPALDSNYGRLHQKALSVAMLSASLAGRVEVTHADWGLGQNVAEAWRRGLHVVYAMARSGPETATKAKAEWRLWDDIGCVLSGLPDDVVASEELLEALRKHDGGRYRSWTTAKLAASVKPEGIEPTRFTVGGTRRRGYCRADIAAAVAGRSSEPGGTATRSGGTYPGGTQAVPHASQHVRGRAAADRGAPRATADDPRSVQTQTPTAAGSERLRVGSDGTDGLFAEGGTDAEERKRAVELLRALLPPGRELTRDEVFVRARELGISVNALFLAHEAAGATIIGDRWSGQTGARADHIEGGAGDGI
ncbi:DUF3987 domain-containing protein [Candidatus Poribacteria bacterium]|jgi:hypothetical protein|nr:DUF3987 domain-containing protein [Candidatus Poribacteria bacterium]MBT5535925.1 DUF3987 domain-containing protein [Candidatus Poribacteria bacterium]MBT5711232.1 DUF3987 domain-containing protein [Candidatus Poribacteria bacterium]MBT7100633.1 DUF3987 domain-containing protein [Candidatus Poribacteria bacterium]MBT7809081.1 DUF3987 domain-containing protein [Candidatus Poribacteria bacterium]